MTFPIPEEQQEFLAGLRHSSTGPSHSPLPTAVADLERENARLRGEVRRFRRNDVIGWIVSALAAAAVLASLADLLAGRG